MLRSLQAVNAKVEMCNVLSDIEIAQSMLAKGEESEQGQQKQVRPWHRVVNMWIVLYALPYHLPACLHPTTQSKFVPRSVVSPRPVR